MVEDVTRSNKLDARDATTNIYLYRMVRCCRPIILLLVFVVLLPCLWYFCLILRIGGHLASKQVDQNTVIYWSQELMNELLSIILHCHQCPAIMIRRYRLNVYDYLKHIYIFDKFTHAQKDVFFLLMERLFLAKNEY